MSQQQRHQPDHQVRSQGEHATCVACGEIWPCAAARSGCHMAEDDFQYEEDLAASLMEVVYGDKDVTE